METSENIAESFLENPNGSLKNEENVELHQGQELPGSSQAKKGEERGGEVKLVPQKNRSNETRNQDGKEGSEISGEDQGSQEDFAKTIKELESQHFVVQYDKLKDPSKCSDGPFYCELCELKLANLYKCQQHVKTKGHKRAKKTKGDFLSLSRIVSPSKHQTLALSKLLDSVFLEHGFCPEKDLSMRQEVAKNVHKTVCAKFSECSVTLYGSSFTGFGLKDSDINLDLVIPDEVNIPHVLLSILELLQKDENYCDVKSEFDAKVPRILFKHLSSGLVCELSPGNISASKTSCLLKKYCDVDPRVRTLVIGLRYWARICNVDCQSEGGLPGYSLALMVIQFLQVTQPPVLPRWVPHEAIDKDSPQATDNFVSKNKEDTGSLWFQLFRFYCLDFDIPNLVISIKDPMPVRREDKKWGHRRIAVEDPFSTKRNVACSLSSDRAYDYLFTCWKNSFRYFGSSPQTGSNTEMQNVSSHLSHKKNGDKTVKNKKQKGKALADEEAIFQMDDLDPLTKQMNSLDISNNDCEDGGLSQRQTTKDGASLESRDQTDMETEVEKSLSGSEGEDGGNSKATETASVDSNEQESSSKAVNNNMDFVQHNIVYRFDAKVFRGNNKPVTTCCFCKEDGHVKERCPDLRKPVLRALPPMTQQFAAVLDYVCQTCRGDFEFEKSEVLYREKVLKNLEGYIHEQYPDARLFLFGSSKNGFGFRNSDIDICMTLENHVKEEVDFVEVITNLAKLLKKHNDCCNVLAITTAKVPIVKFYLRSCKREADISLYNTLALENTKMLATYAQLDDRVVTLGYAVKVFAKVCDIGDASKGSLSSYAYILMLLHYLQQCKPPVIPVLQTLYTDDKPPEKIIDGWNCWFLSDLKKIKSVWNQKEGNTLSAGLLWYGFLRYYTEEFDFEHDVVCCRRTKKLTKFEKMWTKHVFAIEDPFNLDHNLGAGVTKKMANYILTTFIRGRERFGFPRFPPREFLQRYFFDVYFLTDGYEAPTDRNCRICGKIGHIAKDCPHSKSNRRAEQRKEEEERKLAKEAGEKLEGKQKPFSAGPSRPRSASAPNKQGQDKNVDNSKPLPTAQPKAVPSRQDANASGVTYLSKSQPDSQGLASPVKGRQGIQFGDVPDRQSEIPRMKSPDQALLRGSTSENLVCGSRETESKVGISQPTEASLPPGITNGAGEMNRIVKESAGIRPLVILPSSADDGLSNASATPRVQTSSTVSIPQAQPNHPGNMKPPPGFYTPGRVSQLSSEGSPQLIPGGLSQSPPVNISSPGIFHGQPIVTGTPPRHQLGMFTPQIGQFVVSPGRHDMWLRQQGGIMQSPHSPPVRPLVPYPLSPEVQHVQQAKQQWSGPPGSLPVDHHGSPISGHQRLVEHNQQILPQSPPNISRNIMWPLAPNSPPHSLASYQDPAIVGGQQFASHPGRHPPFPQGNSPSASPQHTQFPLGTPPQQTSFPPGTPPQQTHFPGGTPPLHTQFPSQQTQFTRGAPRRQTSFPPGTPTQQTQFTRGAPPGPPVDPPQSVLPQGNTFQPTTGSHMTGEQFINLFRAAEEVKKVDILSTNLSSNEEFESKDLPIAPKNLKVAKTPEEHKLLSKLSKVKSLWEGNATSELQSDCSGPEAISELNPIGHLNIQEQSDVVPPLGDTKSPVKDETCLTVSENESNKKDEEIMVMDQDEIEENVCKAQNDTAPLTKDRSAVTSENFSTEDRASPSSVVTSDEKLEAIARTVDKQPQTRNERQEPAAASVTPEEAPRQKATRRGGRGRKAKGPRQNEATESAPKKQEKTVVDGAKGAKNTQGQIQRQKNRDDFRGDAPKTPPSPLPKKPGAERYEEKPSDSVRDSYHRGAESTPRQVKNRESPTGAKGSAKGAPEVNKQDHTKNARTEKSANSPGDSNKGKPSNRRRRRPRSQTKSEGQSDGKQDSRNRSNSTPVKRQPPNS